MTIKEQVQTIANLREAVETLEEHERDAEAREKERLARSKSWWNLDWFPFGSSADLEAERQEREETRAERARMIEMKSIQIEHHAHALSHLDGSFSETRQRIRELKAIRRGLLARKMKIFRARKGRGKGGSVMEVPGLWVGTGGGGRKRRWGEVDGEEEMGGGCKRWKRGLVED